MVLKKLKINNCMWFLLFFFCFILSVKADEYTIVNKELINYEINNFYIENDNIIINGWAILDKDVQHFLSSDTHEYSLYIENKFNSSDNHIYYGTLLPADKTSMYKYITTNNMCPLNSTFNNAYNCYTKYENVGFSFSIPLSELSSNAEYQIYLRIKGKTANVNYKILIYAPNLQSSYIKNGVQYDLKSDLSTINLTVITEHLFVRSGPDISLNSVYGSYNACSYGKRLYWGEYLTFSTIQEVYQKSKNYDSDTWFRLLYNEGLCQDNRSRAIMGYSHSGWIAGVHTDFSGTPAIIKTTLLESINMGDIITYTNNSGDKGLVSMNLNSKIEQNINVKIYYLDNLVSNEIYEVSGDKEIKSYIDLINQGNVKIIVTEENGVEHLYETEIFISNAQTYVVNEKEKIISPSTPIMVIKNGDNKKYIYEKIEAKIPYNYIKTNAGSPIYAWALINYITDDNRVKINDDITSYEIYTESEKTLGLSALENGKYKIKLDKVESNNNQVLFNLPVMYLSNPDGLVFLDKSKLNNYIVGNRKWYIPLDSEYKVHDYNIFLSNVGVNGINIIFNCSYEVDKKLYGDNFSKYILKRVKTPDDVEYFLNKSYSKIDLTYYKERFSI